MLQIYYAYTKGLPSNLSFFSENPLSLVQSFVCPEYAIIPHSYFVCSWSKQSSLAKTIETSYLKGSFQKFISCERGKEGYVKK